MNKATLIKKISCDAVISKQQAKEALESMLTGITDSLSSGGIQLPGFGTFKTVDRKARKGRNPHSGKEIQIPARKGVRFLPAKALKDSVNE